MWDKAGLLDLARGLVKADFELVASGGTSKFLRSESLPVIDVSDITGAKEMLDGRVKTLHPVVSYGTQRQLKTHLRTKVGKASSTRKHCFVPKYFSDNGLFLFYICRCCYKQDPLIKIL